MGKALENHMYIYNVIGDSQGENEYMADGCVYVSLAIAYNIALDFAWQSCKEIFFITYTTVNFISS